MSDAYPRFTIHEAPPRDSRLAYRVSRDAYGALVWGGDDVGELDVTKYEVPPRFRVKMDPGSRQPVVLFDASRPAYRGRFYTLERAMLEVDNVIRREKGEKERLAWLPLLTEARAKMDARDEEVER